MRLRPMLALLAPLLLPTSAAHAQDFLFGTPAAQVTLRAGPVLHRASGGVFDFFTRELTIDRGDFRALSVGAEAGIIAHDRIDVVFGLAHSEMRSRSEFRDWVDQDDQPIEQSTTLSTTPLSLSLKLYPLRRGQSISRLAWVPARVTPYAGGGAGLTWYRLWQYGDFVAVEDRGIYTDRYEATGAGVTAHVLAGADYWVSAKLGVNVDARYTFGSAPLNQDFEWSRVDVSGLQAGLGLTLRW